MVQRKKPWPAKKFPKHSPHRATEEEIVLNDIAKAVFYIYFFLLTQARYPVTADEKNAPVVASFLSTILGLSRPQGDYVRMACTLRLTLNGLNTFESEILVKKHFADSVWVSQATDYSRHSNTCVVRKKVSEAIKDAYICVVVARDHIMPAAS